jgi:golgi-specific brefeldin A-resistance guanine nucleotide exchange factor 1
MQLPVESLKPLVESLLSTLPDESSPAVIVVKPEVPPSVAPNGDRPVDRGPVYDPGAVYVLELATILALRDSDTLEALGRPVGDALQDIVRDASNRHHMVIARAVYYLFSLLQAGHGHSFLRLPVVVHLVSSLDEAGIHKSAVPLVKGIARCIEEPGPLRNEMASSPDFWKLLKTLFPVSEAAQSVFDIAQDVIIGSASAISADNYESAISLLNAFATAGDKSYLRDQERAKRNARNGRAPKKLNTDNEMVVRGSKAIGTIYQLTNRVPALIEQSQLGRNEGKQLFVSLFSFQGAY